MFACAKICSQAILIAAILVWPPYVPLLQTEVSQESGLTKISAEIF